MPVVHQGSKVCERSGSQGKQTGVSAEPPTKEATMAPQQSVGSSFKNTSYPGNWLAAGVRSYRSTSTKYQG